jgi:outer membrane lipoprotein-sorting protein
MASSTASPAERRRRLAAFVTAAFVALAVTMGAVTTGATTAGAEGVAPVGDLSALLAGMRSSPGVVAHFTETREIALLSSPLAATGTIYFVPPGRLVRLVTSPGRSRLVVDGSKVRFEDEAGSKGLDLSASPMARQMVDSFVVLFSGDEARLKELYSTEYRADGDTWTLKLVPRSAPLDRMIASFEMQGRDSRIDRMVAAEPDGDRTVTLFGDTDVQHRFGEKELADLFAEKPAP